MKQTRNHAIANTSQRSVVPIGQARKKVRMMKFEEKENELEIAHKEAYSIKGSSGGMNYIGAVEGKDGKVNMFWKDAEGSYWFKTYFRVKDKLISDEEYIFGRKIQPVRSYKRKW